MTAGRFTPIEAQHDAGQHNPIRGLGSPEMKLPSLTFFVTKKTENGMIHAVLMGTELGMGYDVDHHVAADSIQFWGSTPQAYVIKSELYTVLSESMILERIGQVKENASALAADLAAAVRNPDSGTVRIPAGEPLGGNDDPRRADVADKLPAVRALRAEAFRRLGIGW